MLRNLIFPRKLPYVRCLKDWEFYDLQSNTLFYLLMPDRLMSSK